MNPTVLALASPKFRDRMVCDYLYHRYPKVAAARQASRMCRRDGTAERFVFLYDTKDPYAKGVGKCDPKTMELFVQAGLWQHDSPLFRDGADTAHERWWRCDE